MSTSEYPIFGCASIRPPLLMMERTIKWKPNNFELSPNCPRCASSNTKFCYYNNYSLSQPRYFCKACRRYWTKGGSLRNVPVGGGCRKTRRTRATRPEGGEDYVAPSDSGFMGLNQSESGGEINLTAVENGEASDKVRANSSDGDTQMGDIDPVFGWGKPVDLINGGDDHLRRMDEHIDGQDFVYQNYNGFEVEGMFGSEVEANMLCSEGINFPSFGSQLQDFEIFSAYDDDDQMRISANPVSDNWGSFDYNIFARP